MVTRREALRRLGLMAAGTVGIGELACGQTDVVTGPLGPLGVQLYTLDNGKWQRIKIHGPGSALCTQHHATSVNQNQGPWRAKPTQIDAGLAVAAIIGLYIDAIGVNCQILKDIADGYVAC